MKKEIIIVIVFVILGIVLFYFDSNDLTGQVVLEPRQDDLTNYTLQILDVMQSRLEISITTKDFDKSKFDLKEFLINNERDLTKARLLKQRLIEIIPSKNYKDAHSSLIISMDYLIKALELAIEGTSQNDEIKLNQAIYYMNLSNKEFDKASSLIRIFKN